MNRRIFEGIVVVSILLQPVLGLVRLWAHKAMATNPPGSLVHTVAEDVTLTIQR